MLMGSVQEWLLSAQAPVQGRKDKGVSRCCGHFARMCATICALKMPWGGVAENGRVEQLELKTPPNDAPSAASAIPLRSPPRLSADACSSTADIRAPGSRHH